MDFYDHIARHEAAHRLEESIMGELVHPEPGWESIGELPEDAAPWFGGVVQAHVTSTLTNRSYAARFYFWLTEGAVVGIGAAIDRDGVEESSVVLIDAIRRPLHGPSRRPRQVIVPSAEMAHALLVGSADSFPDVPRFVDVVVREAPIAHAKAVAFLEEGWRLLETAEKRN